MTKYILTHYLPYTYFFENIFDNKDCCKTLVKKITLYTGFIFVSELITIWGNILNLYRFGYGYAYDSLYIKVI